MASTYEVNIEDVEPMSRTYQYRKVMKPMLERKRRARINKCLDELKDLMVGALQSEGETITKLEKADVLELTVRHLRKLKQHHALAIPTHNNNAHDKFRAGFTHCANEVSRFVTSVPGVDMHVSTRLLSHLGSCINQIDKISTTTTPQQQQQQPPSGTPITPSTTPNNIVPITVTVPRVYTPPASPESKPTIPIIVSPQPTAVSPKPTIPHHPAPAVGRVGVPAGSPVWRPW